MTIVDGIYHRPLLKARQRILARGFLPESNGGIYNPGAFQTRTNPCTYLLCRRERDYEFTAYSPAPALVVIDNCERYIGHTDVTTRGWSPGVRLEDFRPLVLPSGGILVSHMVVPQSWHTVKPALSMLHLEDRASTVLERYDDWILDFPLQSIEKNWALVLADGAQLCAVYSLSPLRVVQRTPRGWQSILYQENDWQVGRSHLSCSTNLIPVMVNGQRHYLGFWHTRIDRVYVQGAYLLDANLHLSHRSGILLDGQHVREGIRIYKAGVCYVSSLLTIGSELLAFYGEGDSHTSVAVFDLDAVLEACWPC